MIRIVIDSVTAEAISNVSILSVIATITKNMRVYIALVSFARECVEWNCSNDFRHQLSIIGVLT